MARITITIELDGKDLATTTMSREEQAQAKARGELWFGPSQTREELSAKLDALATAISAVAGCSASEPTPVRGVLFPDEEFSPEALANPA